MVFHGVSRALAERYARAKPEVCRRCLDYLPYARPRTTPGAWLANAIRDEYGPPAGYLQAQRAAEKKAQAQAAADREKHRQSHEEARRRAHRARLRVAYDRLEKSQGEAFTAFTRYVEQEKVRALRVAVHLRPERKNEHLAAFDTPERRLELFENWQQAERRRQGRKDLPLPCPQP
jgi:hypothetical protein